MTEIFLTRPFDNVEFCLDSSEVPYKAQQCHITQILLNLLTCYLDPAETNLAGISENFSRKLFLLHKTHKI